MAWSRFLIPAVLLLLAATAAVYAVRPRHAITRRRALLGLALTVLLAAVWGGWTIWQAVRPPRAVTVLIADFEGRKARTGIDWGDRIYMEVEEQVERLDLGGRVEVERLYETFADSAQARKAGDARKATMVLWGKYDDRNVWPRFELLRTAKRFEADLGPPPKELADFELYLRSGPQEMAYIVAVVLGLIHYADGNYPLAEELFTAALDAAPTDPGLLGQEAPHFYRAAARFFGRQSADRPMAEIVADLEQAVRLKPDLWEGHWNLALAYTDYCTPTLALDAALAEAQVVRDLRPGDASAYWLMGQVHFRRGEQEQALAALRRATELDPSRAEPLESLGKILDALGQSAEAQTAYARALELRQQAARDRSGRAAAARPADPVEALDWLGYAVEALDWLGYAYLNAGQYDRAIETFEEVLRRVPDSAVYHRHLGNAYYWQGKTDMETPSTGLDKAIAEYEAARRLDPRDSLLLTVLGGAYQEAGRPEDALRAYEEAVEAAPCDDEALFLLAHQYQILGRKADAEAAFRRLAVLNPRQTIAWHWLATAAFEREDYQEAARAYRAAAALEPQDPDLQYGLASSLYALGDYAGAEEAYRQAKTLAPDDAASLAGWGDALDRLGRTDEAIAAYKQAAALAPDYLTWLSLGLLYEKAGRTADAASAYGKAAEARPDDAVAYAALGRTQQRLGEYAQAAASYELAVKYDPEDAASWESLALNYAALSRLDDAQRAAEETLARNPASAAAYMVRASVYEARGDRDRARADYRQALALADGNEALRQLAAAALQRLEE